MVLKYGLRIFKQSVGRIELPYSGGLLRNLKINGTVLNKVRILNFTVRILPTYPTTKCVAVPLMLILFKRRVRGTVRIVVRVSQPRCSIYVTMLRATIQKTSTLTNRRPSENKINTQTPHSYIRKIKTKATSPDDNFATQFTIHFISYSSFSYLERDYNFQSCIDKFLYKSTLQPLNNLEVLIHKNTPLGYEALSPLLPSTLHPKDGRHIWH